MVVKTFDKFRIFANFVELSDLKGNFSSSKTKRFFPYLLFAVFAEYFNKNSRGCNQADYCTVDGSKVEVVDFRYIFATILKLRKLQLHTHCQATGNYETLHGQLIIQENKHQTLTWHKTKIIQFTKSAHKCLCKNSERHNET